MCSDPFVRKITITTGIEIFDSISMLSHRQHCRHGANRILTKLGAKCSTTAGEDCWPCHVSDGNCPSIASLYHASCDESLRTIEDTGTISSVRAGVPGGIDLSRDANSNIETTPPLQFVMPLHIFFVISEEGRCIFWITVCSCADRKVIDWSDIFNLETEKLSDAEELVTTAGICRIVLIVKYFVSVSCL